MTFSLFDKSDATAEMPAVSDGDDRPRRIPAGLTTGDHWFQGITRSIGFFVLLLTGSIGVFLGYMIFPTVHRYGFKFFTETDWSPYRNVLGVASVVVGSVQIAIIALVIAFPLALLTALYISEYAPPRFKAFAIAAIDLMAAIPSIVFGLWGLFLLAPRAIYLSRWFQQNFGWIPFFKVDTDPNASAWAQSRYTGSAFIAGICVAMMVIPIACSVMRGVFSQAPIGEREAALALGSTKWGMIRTVVIPFGRGGIIGGTMLGLGRALGETIAVLLIIAPKFEIKPSVIQTGTDTVSGLIAGNFGETNSLEQLKALLAAGFVLFVLTLFINSVAAVFVSRSRTGRDT